MEWPICDIEDAPLPSAAGEIMVCRLQPRAEDVSRLLPFLNPAERQRAARLRVETPRREFVAGRAVLRRLLSRRTGADPASLVFSTGEHGKPFLADAGLAFNVSHSGGEVLLALGQVTSLGVDLERRREDVEVLDLAAGHFTPQEHDRLLALPMPDRSSLFFRLWTGKEAVLKAHGGGLHVPLRSFSLTVDGRPEIVPLTLDGQASRCFHLREVTFEEGWAAALAIEGEAPRSVQTLRLRLGHGT